MQVEIYRKSTQSTEMISSITQIHIRFHKQDQKPNSRLSVPQLNILSSFLWHLQNDQRPQKPPWLLHQPFQLKPLHLQDAVMENIHYTFVTYTMTFPKLTSSRNFVTSYTLSWITVQTDLLAPLPSLCLETSSREYFCKAAILTKFGEFSRLTGAFRLSKNKLIRNLLSFKAC